MIGFDERETCYLDDCRHSAACHETRWDGAEPTLIFGACAVDGCPCNQYEHTEALAKPPRVKPKDEPSVTSNRLLFFVQWEYTIMSVSDGAGRAADEVFAKMGLDGWEIIDRRYHEHETWYRFKRPVLKGATP